MSNPREITIVANIPISEQVDQRIELTSVLGQNVPQHMLNLLRRGYENWQMVRENVYQHDVYDVSGNRLPMIIEVDGTQSPAVIVTIRSSQNVPKDQEPEARRRLQAEIRRHSVECNRIFNQLVNAAIQEAILRMAEKMGEVDENKWEQMPQAQTNHQCLRLRVRIPG